MGDEMRREVDGKIPYCYDLTGILEPTFYLHIGKGSIPRQIDLASDECLNQGIVVPDVSTPACWYARERARQS